VTLLRAWTQSWQRCTDSSEIFFNSVSAPNPLCRIRDHPIRSMARPSLLTSSEYAFPLILNPLQTGLSSQHSFSPHARFTFDFEPFCQRCYGHYSPCCCSLDLSRGHPLGLLPIPSLSGTPLSKAHRLKYGVTVTTTIPYERFRSC
jgi:hypothetical protein